MNYQTGNGINHSTPISAFPDPTESPLKRAACGVSTIAQDVSEVYLFAANRVDDLRAYFERKSVDIPVDNILPDRCLTDIELPTDLLNVDDRKRQRALIEMARSTEQHSAEKTLLLKAIYQPIDSRIEGFIEVASAAFAANPIAARHWCQESKRRVESSEYPSLDAGELKSFSIACEIEKELKKQQIDLPVPRRDEILAMASCRVDAAFNKTMQEIAKRRAIARHQEKLNEIVRPWLRNRFVEAISICKEFETASQLIRELTGFQNAEKGNPTKTYVAPVTHEDVERSLLVESGVGSIKRWVKRYADEFKLDFLANELAEDLADDVLGQLVNAVNNQTSYWDAVDAYGVSAIAKTLIVDSDPLITLSGCDHQAYNVCTMGITCLTIPVCLTTHEEKIKENLVKEIKRYKPPKFSIEEKDSREIACTTTIANFPAPVMADNFTLLIAYCESRRFHHIPHLFGISEEIDGSHFAGCEELLKAVHTFQNEMMNPKFNNRLTKGDQRDS